jgi:2-dehydro-3-deoxy-D-gluconate 5-dehydrogenase
VSILESFRLDGRTALVTGCRRGIGRAMAGALAEAGADVVGVSANLEPSGSGVEQEITALGREFDGYRCDLGDRQAVYSLLEQLKADVPRIDILVNNAGLVLRQPAAEHSDEYWDRVMAVNLDAQFVLARELGREMIGRRAGKIVFTASLMSYQGGLQVPGYAASKGAISQLTMALANEWAGLGVNVNAIAPGYIETDATQALQDDAERRQQILQRIPAGRWGQTRDLGGALVFLCSDASEYVHGITLLVDGGWMGR